MRVLGCGASPPPKRQFSSANSIRDTIARGILGVKNDSPVKTFLEGAESYARDQIAKDDRSDRRSLRSFDTWRDCDTLSELYPITGIHEQELVRSTFSRSGKLARTIAQYCRGA
ncbi:hypothetical protein X777_14987 [Ooceraea biroi]|uniref:Uncharacterized protein n=1 Tax=Ooceraea biroi TaxID=2015173 RepID=A0A026WS81_OOCBI|nr:hypothetical protein X777_14987 [Ooceraea biroi]